MVPYFAEEILMMERKREVEKAARSAWQWSNLKPAAKRKTSKQERPAPCCAYSRASACC